MNKNIALGLLSFALLSSVFAADDNGCSDFHIQISNQTGDTCVLLNQKVAHGNLITSPPLSILPNDSKRFDMTQTFSHGPAIELSYQCGVETISFTSQQNACIFEAGNISGEVLTPVPVNLYASYTAILGSYYWERSGSINWKIEKVG